MVWDHEAFRWVNGWPESWSPVFVFISEATKLPPGRIGLGLLGLALLAHPKTRATTLLALLGFLLANGLTEALKTAVPFLRPCVELPDVNLRVGLLTTYGTASSHSANTAAIAAVFLMRHGRWGLIPAVLALLTGLSRIYVGAHYPSQVLLGWVCGALCALIAVYTWGAYARLRSGRSHGKIAPVASDNSE